jgi:hypothetical protein
MFLQRKLGLVETGILEKSNNLSQVTDKRKRTKRDICKTRCPEELSEPPVSIHQNLHYCLLVILHTIKFVSTFTSLVLWKSCLLFMRFEWIIVGSVNQQFLFSCSYKQSLSFLEGHTLLPLQSTMVELYVLLFKFETFKYL